MASKRDNVAKSPAEPAPPEPSPTAYRDLTSALINALDGFLVPLVALREKAQAAGDAEVYVAQAQQRLDALTAMIDARRADAAEADAQVELAQRNAQVRVGEIRASVGAERDRAQAEIARIREDKAREVDVIEAGFRNATAARNAQLADLDAKIAAKLTELREAEGALTRVRDAQAEFARLAGAGR